MYDSDDPSPRAAALDRRELLAYTAWFGAAFLAAQGIESAAGAEPQTARRAPPAKRYEMKKSINLWAFPYPQRMPLDECFRLAKQAGFDAVEVNYALEGDLSPSASESDLRAIGRRARDAGIEISGLCSFLYWPYSLTANDPQRRAKGMDLARQMIATAHALATENLLVIAGSVYIPWLPEMEPVPNDVCAQRSREAIRTLLPEAEKAGVRLNLENIFANGFLLSPDEMNAFVDSFHSEHVRVHFDTGNIMQYQFPEDWIRLLGRRIQNVHFKEYDKRAGTEFKLESFRPLLDGTTNWPAVMEALDAVGYRGYLTFEYFHPFQHWPEALIHQTADALDRMLGRTA
ncbi:MAG TPA: sugar phosphate isomerase/epimerase family protein [Pirellulales bacterium]|jgi:hexulose-6-phosphate isomerase|nr:sugar phosphate isomerase/epimerase family protein [Pirellulales bacterium]